MKRTERLCLWVMAAGAFLASVLSIVEVRRAEWRERRVGAWLMVDTQGCLHCGGCGRVKVEKWIVTESVCSEDFDTWCLKCFAKEGRFEQVERVVITNDSLRCEELEDFRLFENLER